MFKMHISVNKAVRLGFNKYFSLRTMIFQHGSFLCLKKENPIFFGKKMSISVIRWTNTKQRLYDKKQDNCIMILVDYSV